MDYIRHILRHTHGRRTPRGVDVYGRPAVEQSEVQPAAPRLRRLGSKARTLLWEK